MKVTEPQDLRRIDLRYLRKSEHDLSPVISHIIGLTGIAFQINSPQSSDTSQLLVKRMEVGNFVPVQLEGS